MDEHNQFENQSVNQQTEQEHTAFGETEQPTVSAPVNEVSQPIYAPETVSQQDQEIDLDPDIAQMESDTSFNGVSGQFYANGANVPPVDPMPNMQGGYQHPDIEPIAPIMPQIGKTEYQPADISGTSRGMKVFAVIIALMVLISACVTGGYFLGRSSSGMSGAPTVDLAKKPAAENAKTTSQVYAEVNPGVVGIYVYNDEKIGSTASGVIYSEDGYIITNDHIYEGTTLPQFKVYTSDGKAYSAEYVAGDTRSDLAVLKIKDATGFTPVTLGNSDELSVGETVIAIGRPNGASKASTASEGIVSVTSTRVSTTSSYTSKLIQTDSAINPGSSGGALCNVYGQVIGITSAKLVGSEYEGVGYAIPTVTVKKIVDSLIENKTVKGRAKLGISYLEINELTAEMSGIPCGLQIAEIDKASDLYGKSVSVGDIITHINGTEITGAELVLDIIENSTAGDTITLTVYSSTKKTSFDVSVKLLEDPGSSSYTTEETISSDSDKSSEQYNSSEFNFPNGN